MVDWGTVLGIGAVVFFAIAGGIYVGVRLALDMAGEFVDETLTAIETVAYKLLANKTLQDLIRAADKIPNVGGKDGIMGKIGGFLGKLVGTR